MIRRLAMCLAVLAAPSVAEEVSLGTGAVLRGLDRVNGLSTDLEIPNGGTAVFESLTVDLGECRYPIENVAGNAYAFLTIRDQDTPEPVFQGWMMASAPALNALDHPRYDVWVLRCSISEAD
ncbi:MAG: DUF2155 domain-containing protein [Thalassovita sp.]